MELRLLLLLLQLLSNNANRIIHFVLRSKEKVSPEPSKPVGSSFALQAKAVLVAERPTAVAGTVAVAAGAVAAAAATDRVRQSSAAVRLLLWPVGTAAAGVGFAGVAAVAAEYKI